MPQVPDNSSSVDDLDLTVTDLAERLQVTQQAASKAVADLRKRGWLRQQVDPQDARARRIGLTETGPGGDRGRPTDPRRVGRRNGCAAHR